MNKPAPSAGQSSDRAAPAAGIGREFGNLKEHGSATIAELQAFLAGMKGKSTREFLGALAESGLVRATIQATAGTILLAAVFTVGPYLLGQSSTKPAANGASGPTATPAGGAAAATSAATSDGSSGGAPSSGTAATGGVAEAATTGPATGKSGAPGTSPVSPADLQKAADILGVGEAKSADPKTNPLEKDLDSLLDKVK